MQTLPKPAYIPEGESRAVPDPSKLVVTIGVMSMRGVGFDKPEDDYLFEFALSQLVKQQYAREPDICTDGGNDKYFFTLTFRGTKLFAAANELGGITVMLPEEY